MFKMESRHLLNSSVQNALDCITGGACALNSLEKCAVRSPYGRSPSFFPSSLSPTLLLPVTQARRYRSHILPLYTISLGPLASQISPGPPQQHTWSRLSSA